MHINYNSDITQTYCIIHVTRSLTMVYALILKVLISTLSKQRKEQKYNTQYFYTGK